MSSAIRARCALLATLAWLAAHAHADVGVPPGFVETTIATGLDAPTTFAFAPDGRLFVAEQGGTLRVIKDGVLLATPFLSLAVDTNGERGLLGIAFDPAFATNQYVYVYYTTPSPLPHNRVSRFTANGDVALAGSEVPILELENLGMFAIHNGGAIHFGPDGRLYVAVGENNTPLDAQSLDTRSGKILRIDADGGIPADNPFYATAAGVNRAIWALGLRNPFTFAFGRESGRMFIDDVGAGTWEEIDVGEAGANYGWPYSEGATDTAGETTPLYYYGHGDGPFLGCAIAGGAFYEPPAQAFPPDYRGRYFFADLCGGWINVLDPAAGSDVATFASGIESPVDVEVGADGDLYYLARGSDPTGGYVGRIAYGAARSLPQPVITSPLAGARYGAGDIITVSGDAQDALDGTLPAAAFTWQVDFHHDDPPARVDVVIPPTIGVKGGAFVTATTGDTSTNVFYRITLTVVNSAGVAASAFRDVLPQVSTLRLATDPPGMQVTLDGEPHVAPYVGTSVVGMPRSLGVVTPQHRGGVLCRFLAWSDRRDATHAIVTAVEDATYTAIFAADGRVRTPEGAGAVDSAAPCGP